jgi:hypothetical protein
MINYTCRIITGNLLCGRPLKKIPNPDPLTQNYFDLFVCKVGHRVLFLQSCDTESDRKVTPRAIPRKAEP